MENRVDFEEEPDTDSQTDAFPILKKRCLEVLPSIPTTVKQNDLYYPMKRPDRGLAIIFSHEFYDEIDGKPLETRDGTLTDVERLNGTLSDLGFQVDIQENLTYAEIRRHISDVSKRQELFDHDCLAVFVLTHGDENEKVYARDRSYFVKELVLPFTGENCLQLANKPKLFFIQACKGGKMHNKINMRTMADGAKVKDGDASNMCGIYSIPADSDVLISYATLEGYIALRDPAWGTPYILCICDELEKNGTRLDLLTILIRVHHRLATSTYKLKGTNQLIKVQPSFLCYLNRFLRFDTPTFCKAQTQ